MLWIFTTDNHYHTMATNDPATVTAWFYRGANFHEFALLNNLSTLALFHRPHPPARKSGMQAKRKHDNASFLFLRFACFQKTLNTLRFTTQCPW